MFSKNVNGGTSPLRHDSAVVSIGRTEGRSRTPAAATYSATASLVARALACERNDRVLFAGLDFRVNAGELLQIDGPNGSGKTTLLRLVCGIALADDGEVLWCGRPIDKVRTDYFSHMAYVGHKPGIKDELTPIENLEMDRSLAGGRSAVSPHEALERLQLRDHDDVPCRTLSAGQRRRVALARLLVVRAQLWVLDEPLTSLDRNGQNLMRDLLVEHAQMGGMALFTTHHAFEWAEHPVTTIRLGRD